MGVRLRCASITTRRQKVMIDLCSFTAKCSMSYLNTNASGNRFTHLDSIICSLFEWTKSSKSLISVSDDKRVSRTEACIFSVTRMVRIPRLPMPPLRDDNRDGYTNIALCLPMRYAMVYDIIRIRCPLRIRQLFKECSLFHLECT